MERAVQAIVGWDVVARSVSQPCTHILPHLVQDGRRKAQQQLQCQRVPEALQGGEVEEFCVSAALRCKAACDLPFKQRTCFSVGRGSQPTVRTLR